jgi:hypothetical protein
LKMASFATVIKISKLRLTKIEIKKLHKMILF